MKCPKCGRELSGDLLFCPGCGSKVTESVYSPDDGFKDSETSGKIEETRHIPRVDVPYYEDSLQGVEEYNDDMYYGEAEYEPEDRVPYYEASTYSGRLKGRNDKGRKSNTWLIVIAAILAAAVVVSVIFLFASGGVNSKKENSQSETPADAYTCGICGNETDNNEGYCKKCKEEYTCVKCGKISKETKDAYCADCTVEYTCRECEKLDDEVKDGYCEDCRDRMKCKGSGCNAVVENGYYCDDCVSELVSAENKGVCFWCEKKISNEEVFLIDTYGSPYCLDCDTGKYCTECNGYLESGSTKNVCVFCAEFYCSDCGKVLELDDVSVTDNNGKYYCADCNTGFYCSNCGAPVTEGESVCTDCSGNAGTAENNESAENVQ